MSIQDRLTTQKKMNDYYTHAFPMKTLYDWINYGCNNPDERAKRELSTVTWTPEDTEGFIARYVSCKSLNQFSRLFIRDERFLDAHSQYVLKLDIGPIFDCDASQARNAQGTPKQRELVFDIDMDDYNEVRTCCQDKKVCPKCFKFLAGAAKVLNHVLRSHLGFQHLLFVFSGRRGIHCWVNDSIVRTMTSDQRSGVVSYIQVKIDGSLRPTLYNHPLIIDSIDRIKDDFYELLQTQKYFANPISRSEFITKTIQPEKPREWAPADSKKYDDRALFEMACHAHEKEHFRERAILRCIYPRLDVEVSKHMNHLLKSPFCIHPATGNVCVPINIDEIDHFDLTAVPNLNSIITELYAIRENTPIGARTRVTKSVDGDDIIDLDASPQSDIIMKTSMGKYIKFFHEYVQHLITTDPYIKSTNNTEYDDDGDDDQYSDDFEDILF